LRFPEQDRRMNDRNGLDIAILGGGPIGLACALLLARAGLGPVIYDARLPAATQMDRRLLALSRGSWQTLSSLLADRLPPRASIVDVHVSSAGEFGATLLRADEIDPHGGAPLGATVHYGALHAALNAAVEAQPVIRIERPVHVRQVRQCGDRVELDLDDADGHPQTRHAAVAIHAEGSPPASPGTPTAWALLADLRLHGTAAGVAFERFTREGPLALLPAPGADGPAWSLVWCMDETQANRRASLDPAALRDELQRAIGPRIAQVQALSTPRAVPLPQIVRDRVADGRLAWIGNAAQTLHPVAGQGMNLGLRDACTLVDCLAESTDDPARALETFAARRRADRALIAQLTRWLPPVFATRALPAALLRSAGLTAMNLAPPLRQQWARLLMFGMRS
jgi:2-octaprenyl-6-methoxyphenol hydroxylase